MRLSPWFLLLSGCGFGLSTTTSPGADTDCDSTAENCCTGSIDTVEVKVQDLVVSAEATCPDMVGQWLVQIDGATAASAEGTGPTTPISLHLDLEDYGIVDGEHTLTLQVSPGGDLPYKEVASTTFESGEAVDTGQDTGDTGDTGETAVETGDSEDSGPVKLAQLAPADPVLSPAEGEAGDTVTLYCTVYNTGAADAEANTGEVWWSADATLDASDTLLTTFTVGKALADDFTPVTQDLTIPSVALGTWWVFVSVDTEGTIEESEERDNTVVTTFTVDGIDLVVDTPTLSSTAGAAGDTVVATWGVRNAGTVDAGGFGVALFWSTDTVFDGGDRALSAWGEAGLAAGASTGGTVNVQIPGDITTDGYVLAVIDPGGAVGETDEANNTGSTAYDLQSVDLQVALDGLDTYSVSIGDTLAGDITVINAGIDTATSFSVDVYLSADEAYDGSDALIQSIPFSYLLGGGESPIGFSGTVPTNAPVGTVYALVVVDAGDAVSETDDTNNTAADWLDVDGPDLAPDINSLTPATVSAGSAALMSWHVRNWASVAVAASTADVWLSADTTLDGGDTLLTSVSVAAMSSYNTGTNTSTYVTIPSGTASGAWYLLMVADPSGLLGEKDETNNLDSYGFVVD